MRDSQAKRDKLTNRAFAKEYVLFIRACKLAGIPATKRQASKWRNGRGKARAFLLQASDELQSEGVLNAKAS